MPENRRLWIVVGQTSNLRDLFGDAVRCGAKRDIEVEFLDVSGLVPFWRPFPNDWKALGLESRVTRIETFRSLDSLLRSEAADAVMALLAFLPDRHSRPIWKHIQEMGIRTGAITVGTLPLEELEERAGWRSWQLAVRVKRAVIEARRALTRLQKPSPDYWIVSGRRCLDHYGHFFRSLIETRMIQAHSADYERVLASQKGEAVRAGTGSSPVAYLDQGWFSKAPPGYMKKGSYPPVEEASFAAEMRSFLARAEKLFQRRVVVCAHPKSSLDHTRALFPDHEVQFKRTNEIVADAHAVIATASTSVQYAAIHRKPVIFVTTKQLSRTYIQSYIRGYSRALQAPIVFAHDDEKLQQAVRNLDVSAPAYDRFLRDYVIAEPDGDNRSLWEKVMDGVSKLYD